MIILFQVIVHNFINSVCPNTRINTAALLSGSALSSVAFHLTLGFYFRKKIRLIMGKSACDMPYSYSDLYLSLYILIPVHDVYSFMAISRYVYIVYTSTSICTSEGHSYLYSSFVSQYFCVICTESKCNCCS